VNSAAGLSGKEALFGRVIDGFRVSIVHMARHSHFENLEKPDSSPETA